MTSHGDKAVSDRLLRVVLAKHPKHIPSLYRTVLDERPELRSSELAEAVLHCKIPDAENLGLFRPL